MRRYVHVAALLCGMLAPAVMATNEIAITWWGCMSVEVNIGDINLVFDPYVKPVEPRFQYIFVSHDHYDHCHEATLRKLIQPDSPFEMLFASRGCFYASRLESYENWPDIHLSDLTFVPREKAVALYPKFDDSVNSHFRHGVTWSGPTEIVTGRIRVEAFRSHEHPVPAKRYRAASELKGDFPNLGYLVTDLDSGFSVAHTGDIWNDYPAMKEMRGKVDILFYPLGKLSLAQKQKMMDCIRPGIAIPTHYRLPDSDFPIPPLYLKEMKEEDVPKSEESFRRASLGHWYPSPADPPAEIAAQREAFKELTRVVELNAGVRYVLPGKLDEFQGRDAK